MVCGQFIDGLPAQVQGALEDVEVIIADSPAIARVALNEALKEKNFDTDEFDKEPIPDDCKGLFVGVPTEVEESDESEEEEVVFYPEGFIVLCLSNLESVDEASVVLMHEIGHALGMDEDEVKNLGLGDGPPQEKGESDVSSEVSQ